jgi:hypothetical protein
VIDQALKDIVEQPDLFVGIVDRAVDEEIRHPAQGLDPAGDGAMRQRALQFVEQMSGMRSCFRTHGSVLEKKAGGGFSATGKIKILDQALVMRLRPCALAA